MTIVSVVFSYLSFVEISKIGLGGGGCAGTRVCLQRLAGSLDDRFQGHLRLKAVITLEKIETSLAKTGRAATGKPWIKQKGQFALNEAQQTPDGSLCRAYPQAIRYNLWISFHSNTAALK